MTNSLEARDATPSQMQDRPSGKINKIINYLNLPNLTGWVTRFGLDATHRYIEALEAAIQKTIVESPKVIH